MADNTVLNAGSGGDTIATEDRGSYKTPISLIDVGGRTGAEAVIGDSGVSMPVKGIGTAGTANSGVITVQGIASMTPIQIADNSGSITVDNGGTFAVQAAQTGTWTVTGTGGTFPITDSGGSITIDNATLSATGGGLETGALRVTIASDSTGVLSIDDNGSSITVDGTVAATQSGTWTVTGAGGTFPVTDSGGSLTVDNAGTFAVQAAQSGTWNVGTVTTVTGVTTVSTVTTCSTVTNVTNLIGSSVAHDAADSQNPHKIGARATTALSGLTLVADADRTHLYAGVDGVLITRPHCNLEDLVNGTADITDGSSTSVIAAQGASVKTYITDVIISNSSASAVTVTIRDGAAGTVKATFMVPAGAPVHKVLTSPIGFSANTAVCADPSAAASTVSVTLSGFKSRV